MSVASIPDAPVSDEAMTVFVCVSCRRAAADGGEGFDLPGRVLAGALQDRLSNDPHITVTPVECLAVCNRPSTIALVGRNRWTYLIGNLDTELHLDQIVDSARAFANSDNGIIPWKERPECFRKGVVARIPPLGFSHPESTP
jgi:predicted metal-binding protein